MPKTTEKCRVRHKLQKLRHNQEGGKKPLVARSTTLDHAKLQQMWIQPTHWEAFSECPQEECTNT